MKLIALDRFLYPGGVETLKVNLLPEIAKQIELLVWVLPSYKIPYFQERLPSIPNLVFEPIEWPYGNAQRYTDSLVRKANEFVRNKQLPAPGKSLLNYLAQLSLDHRLSHIAKKFQATHVVDTSVFDAPMPHTDLSLSGIICDLNWRSLPETHPPDVVKRMESILSDYLQKSDVLFPISNFTKAQIDEFLPEHPAPLKPIRLAAKGSPLKTESNHRDKSLLYFPAAATPQKNHMGALRAAAELAAKNVDFQLVLTGYSTELLVSEKPTPYPHIEQCRNFYWNNKLLWGRVQALGQCDYAKVEDLYATCCAVIFPSLYEGFGLPVLEALTHQAPVICSAIPPVVEQLQFYDCLDAVTLFDPMDSSALASCMEDALGGKLKVMLSGDEVEQRLSKWTWANVASAYVEQLQLHTKKNS